MRKVIFVLVASVMLLSLLTSCQKGPADELKLREDFLVFLSEAYPDYKWELDDIQIYYYFGNYGGCDVVYMKCDLVYTMALRPVEIAGYTIIFGSGEEAYVYKNSKFYTIKEAYDAKLISKIHVYRIGKQIGPVE